MSGYRVSIQRLGEVATLDLVAVMEGSVREKLFVDIPSLCNSINEVIDILLDPSSGIELQEDEIVVNFLENALPTLTEALLKRSTLREHVECTANTFLIIARLLARPSSHNILGLCYLRNMLLLGASPNGLQFINPQSLQSSSTVPVASYFSRSTAGFYGDYGMPNSVYIGNKVLMFWPDEWQKAVGGFKALGHYVQWWAPAPPSPPATVAPAGTVAAPETAEEHIDVGEEPVSTGISEKGEGGGADTHNSSMNGTNGTWRTGEVIGYKRLTNEHIIQPENVSLDMTLATAGIPAVGVNLSRTMHHWCDAEFRHRLTSSAGAGTAGVGAAAAASTTTSLAVQDAARKAGGDSMLTFTSSHDVGHVLRIWWPKYEKYFYGRVVGYDLNARQHMICYEDGDLRPYDMRTKDYALVVPPKDVLDGILKNADAVDPDKSVAQMVAQWHRSAYPNLTQQEQAASTASSSDTLMTSSSTTAAASSSAASSSASTTAAAAAAVSAGGDAEVEEEEVPQQAVAEVEGQAGGGGAQALSGTSSRRSGTGMGMAAAHSQEFLHVPRPSPSMSPNLSIYQLRVIEEYIREGGTDAIFASLSGNQNIAEQQEEEEEEEVNDDGNVEEDGSSAAAAAAVVSAGRTGRNQPLAPPPISSIILSHLQLIFQLRPYVGTDSFIDLAWELKESVPAALLRYGDAQIKELTVKTMGDILSGLRDTMNLAISGNQYAYNGTIRDNLEVLRLSLAMKLLDCSQLQKRYLGLSMVKEALERVMPRLEPYMVKRYQALGLPIASSRAAAAGGTTTNTTGSGGGSSSALSSAAVAVSGSGGVLTALAMDQWLVEHGVVEVLFGTSLQQDLAAKGDVILTYMASRRILTEAHIDRIWQASLGVHEAVVRVLHQLLLVIVPVLEPSLRMYLFSLLANLPSSEFTEHILILIKNFTIQALLAFKEEAKKAPTTQAGGGGTGSNGTGTSNANSASSASSRGGGGAESSSSNSAEYGDSGISSTSNNNKRSSVTRKGLVMNVAQRQWLGFGILWQCVQDSQSFINSSSSSTNNNNIDNNLNNKPAGAAESAPSSSSLSTPTAAAAGASSSSSSSGSGLSEGLVDLAIQLLIELLEEEFSDERELVLQRCLDNIQLGVSVPVSLQIMRKTLSLYPLAPKSWTFSLLSRAASNANKQNTVPFQIEKLIKESQLLEILFRDLDRYHQSVLQMSSSSDGGGAGAGGGRGMKSTRSKTSLERLDTYHHHRSHNDSNSNLLLRSRVSHIKGVTERLDFIRFVISWSPVRLTEQQTMILWNAFGKNADTPETLEKLAQWFNDLLSGENKSLLVLLSSLAHENDPNEPAVHSKLSTFVSLGGGSSMGREPTAAAGGGKQMSNDSGGATVSGGNRRTLLSGSGNVQFVEARHTSPADSDSSLSSSTSSSTAAYATFDEGVLVKLFEKHVLDWGASNFDKRDLLSRRPVASLCFKLFVLANVSNRMLRVHSDGSWMRSTPTTAVAQNSASSIGSTGRLVGMPLIWRLALDATDRDVSAAAVALLIELHHRTPSSPTANATSTTTPQQHSAPSLNSTSTMITLSPGDQCRGNLLRMCFMHLYFAIQSLMVGDAEVTGTAEQEQRKQQMLAAGGSDEEWFDDKDHLMSPAVVACRIARLIYTLRLAVHRFYQRPCQLCTVRILIGRDEAPAVTYVLKSTDTVGFLRWKVASYFKDKAESIQLSVKSSTGLDGIAVSSAGSGGAGDGAAKGPSISLNLGLSSSTTSGGGTAEILQRDDVSLKQARLGVYCSIIAQKRNAVDGTTATEIGSHAQQQALIRARRAAGAAKDLFSTQDLQLNLMKPLNPLRWMYVVGNSNTAASAFSSPSQNPQHSITETASIVDQEEDEGVLLSNEKRYPLFAIPPIPIESSIVRGLKDNEKSQSEYMVAMTAITTSSPGGMDKPHQSLQQLQQREQTRMAHIRTVKQGVLRTYVASAPQYIDQLLEMLDGYLATTAAEYSSASHAVSSRSGRVSPVPPPGSGGGGGGASASSNSSSSLFYPGQQSADLSGVVWDILQSLPVHVQLQESIQNMALRNEATLIPQLLPRSCPYRLLYSLQIMESLLLPPPAPSSAAPAASSSSSAPSSSSWGVQFFQIGGTEYLHDLLDHLLGVSGADAQQRNLDQQEHGGGSRLAVNNPSNRAYSNASTPASLSPKPSSAGLIVSHSSFHSVAHRGGGGDAAAAGMMMPRCDLSPMTVAILCRVLHLQLVLDPAYSVWQPTAASTTPSTNTNTSTTTMMTVPEGLILSSVADVASLVRQLLAYGVWVAGEHQHRRVTSTAVQAVVENSMLLLFGLLASSEHAVDILRDVTTIGVSGEPTSREALGGEEEEGGGGGGGGGDANYNVHLSSQNSLLNMWIMASCVACPASNVRTAACRRWFEACANLFQKCSSPAFNSPADSTSANSQEQEDGANAPRMSQTHKRVRLELFDFLCDELADVVLKGNASTPSNSPSSSQTSRIFARNGKEVYTLMSTLHALRLAPHLIFPEYTSTAAAAKISPSLLPMPSSSSSVMNMFVSLLIRHSSRESFHSLHPDGTLLGILRALLVFASTNKRCSDELGQLRVDGCGLIPFLYNRCLFPPTCSASASSDSASGSARKKEITAITAMCQTQESRSLAYALFFQLCQQQTQQMPQPAQTQLQSQTTTTVAVAELTSTDSNLRQLVLAMGASVNTNAAATNTAAGALTSSSSLMARLMPSWDYDPSALVRDPTAFVGLCNQGGTCYMNSFMQQLFHIPVFRNGILRIEQEAKLRHLEGEEKEEEEDPDATLLFQLQVMFGFMALSQKRFYNTLPFCQSFLDFDGSPISLTEQKDINEFAGMLFDKLESNPRAKRLLKNVFQGTSVWKTKSLEDSYRSEREECFYMLTAEVKDKSTLEDSLGLFTAEELFSGDNKIQTDRGHKVDALRHCAVRKLPPVLIVHLKRFEFDLETLTRKKLNDRISFPLRLNMFPYTEEGLLAKEEEEEEEESQSHRHEAQGGGGEEEKEEERMGLDIDADAPEEDPADTTRRSSSYAGRSEENPEQAQQAQQAVPPRRQNKPAGYYEYLLKGVVAHVGAIDRGHYYSFIKDADADDDAAAAGPSSSSSSSFCSPTTAIDHSNGSSASTHSTSPEVVAASGNNATSNSTNNGGSSDPSCLVSPEAAEDTGSSSSSSSSSYSASSLMGNWREFNDSNVLPFSAEAIPAECFGGREEYVNRNGQVMQRFRENNAYLLVYEQVWKEAPCDEEEEEEEGKRKENEEATQTQMARSEVVIPAAAAAAAAAAEEEAAEVQEESRHQDQDQGEYETERVDKEGESAIASRVLHAVSSENAEFQRDRFLFHAHHFSFLWQLLQLPFDKGAKMSTPVPALLDNAGPASAATDGVGSSIAELVYAELKFIVEVLVRTRAQSCVHMFLERLESAIAQDVSAAAASRLLTVLAQGGSGSGGSGGGSDADTSRDTTGVSGAVAGKSKLQTDLEFLDALCHPWLSQMLVFCPQPATMKAFLRMILTCIKVYNHHRSVRKEEKEDTSSTGSTKDSTMTVADEKRQLLVCNRAACMLDKVVALVEQPQLDYLGGGGGGGFSAPTTGVNNAAGTTANAATAVAAGSLVVGSYELRCLMLLQYALLGESERRMLIGIGTIRRVVCSVLTVCATAGQSIALAEAKLKYAVELIARLVSSATIAPALDPTNPPTFSSQPLQQNINDANTTTTTAATITAATSSAAVESTVIDTSGSNAATNACTTIDDISTGAPHYLPLTSKTKTVVSDSSFPSSSSSSVPPSVVAVMRGEDAQQNTTPPTPGGTGLPLHEEELLAFLDFTYLEAAVLLGANETSAALQHVCIHTGAQSRVCANILDFLVNKVISCTAPATGTSLLYRPYFRVLSELIVGPAALPAINMHQSVISKLSAKIQGLSVRQGANDAEFVQVVSSLLLRLSLLSVDAHNLVMRYRDQWKQVAMKFAQSSRPRKGLAGRSGGDGTASTSSNSDSTSNLASATNSSSFLMN